MKKLFFVIAFFIGTFSISTTAFSQASSVKYTISGEVIDSVTQKGVEFATVGITDGQRSISMTAADGNGKFSLDVKEKGDFQLVVSSIGYSSAAMAVSIDGSQQKIDAGKILLSEGDIQLAEVVVEAQRPLIRLDTDKLTYSVDADPEAQTSTLAEMLRKVPQLSVDAEDNVRLNGQTNYKVLVNGKNSSLYNNNFKEVIRSMPASSIKDIEVITNPSSKYEAEGIGGIINIITNRTNNNGYNGSINLNANHFGGYGANGYLAAQLGKLTFSTNYFYNHHTSPWGKTSTTGENFLSDTYRYTNNSGRSKNKNDWQALSVEASYDIDSLNLITLALWWNDGMNKSRSISDIRNTDIDENLTRHYLNNGNGKSSFGYLSGSIDYQKLYMKPDKTLTFSYKIERNPSKTDYITDIQAILDYISYTQSSWNKATGTEHTVQVDYYDPLNKNHSIEFGGKYILRQNVSNSDVREYDPVDGIWIPNPARINDLDYDQHIAALYGGYQYKKNKFSVKGGVRAEHTWNDGVSKQSTGNVKFDNKLFNVIPYVTLSYSLQPMKVVRLSYTQRIQRPGIWYLNPYVNDNDPMNIWYGNPALKSVVSHSISTNYSTFGATWNLILSLSANFSNNTINQISVIDLNNVKRTTYENSGKNQRYGINASYNYRLGTKFNLYLSANGDYTKIKSKSNELENDGFSFGGNAGFNVTVWPGGSVRAGGGAMSTGVSLQSNSTFFYYNSIGLSQQMLKKKLTLNVSVNSPFEKYMKYKFEYNDPTFTQKMKYYNPMRQARFSVGYRFGKMNTQVKKAKRTISNDDKMQGGGQQQAPSGN